ncbi:MAG: FliM/FliN family flagellar motor switch protein [Acidobacteria bacterium]|nr:FliM/FliN family flagellar motor switch protein [Acidobacteriota bacterium]MBI3472523.1 FliM/FliN family flagellar motor switch protein [Candidatus Solibacter usitatus]
MNSLGLVENYQEVNVTIEAELDRRKMTLRQILALGVGSVIATSRPAGEDLAIYAGGALLGYGEVVTLDKSMGIRITEFREAQ